MLGGLAVAIVFWVRPEVALEPPQYGLAKAWGFKAIVATVGVWGPYLISWRFANDDVLGHRKFYLWVVLSGGFTSSDRFSSGIGGSA